VRNQSSFWSLDRRWEAAWKAQSTQCLWPESLMMYSLFGLPWPERETESLLLSQLSRPNIGGAGCSSGLASSYASEKVSITLTKKGYRVQHRVSLVTLEFTAWSSSTILARWTRFLNPVPTGRLTLFVVLSEEHFPSLSYSLSNPGPPD